MDTIKGKPADSAKVVDSTTTGTAQKGVKKRTTSKKGYWSALRSTGVRKTFDAVRPLTWMR